MNFNRRLNPWYPRGVDLYWARMTRDHGHASRTGDSLVRVKYTTAEHYSVRKHHYIYRSPQNRSAP